MKNFFKNIEEWISCFFISVTIIVVILNVVMRYFFNHIFKGAEEIATICFIWSVFVGAAAAYKHRMHMGIDMLTQMMPYKIRKILEIFINILLVIINAVLFYLGTLFTFYSRIKPTAVTGLSSSFVNGALVVGFGLITFHAVEFLVDSIKSFKSFNSEKEISIDEDDDKLGEAPC